MTNPQQQNRIQNPEEVIRVLNVANQKLAAELGTARADLALSHAQVELLQEAMQQMAQRIAELEGDDEEVVQPEIVSTPKKAAPKKAANKR